MRDSERQPRTSAYLMVIVNIPLLSRKIKRKKINGEGAKKLSGN